VIESGERLSIEDLKALVRTVPDFPSRGFCSAISPR
jgi:hypothetical protein